MDVNIKVLANFMLPLDDARSEVIDKKLNMIPSLMQQLLNCCIYRESADWSQFWGFSSVL